MMSLELASFPVHRARFGRETRYRDGELTVARDAVREQILRVWISNIAATQGRHIGRAGFRVVPLDSHHLPPFSLDNPFGSGHQGYGLTEAL